MLTYSFDNTGSDSLYEHLYKCIKNDILSGELAPDYKLPSKRSFAKNLGISTITVENAYAQLIAEGYIYSLPKKGYYVTDIAAVGQPVFAASYSHSQPENTNFLSAAHTSLTFSKQPDADTSYQIDFSTNHASGANFPFYTESFVYHCLIHFKFFFLTALFDSLFNTSFDSLFDSFSYPFSFPFL